MADKEKPHVKTPGEASREGLADSMKGRPKPENERPLDEKKTPQMKHRAGPLPNEKK